MSKLKPTLEELQSLHAERQRVLAEREATWTRRHRDFTKRTAIIGGILLVLSARLAALGGHMGWLAYLLLAPAGAGAAWLIASRGWGILLGMAIYGGSAGLAWVCCSACGWWGGFEAGVFSMGSYILLFFAWLLWLVVGGFIGHFSSQFDNDHQQV